MIIALSSFELDAKIVETIEPVLNSYGYEIHNWPHITLNIFKDINRVTHVCEKMISLAHQIAPFKVVIEGIGKFDKQKVIYLKIKKTPEICKIRTQVLKIFYPFPLWVSILNWHWIPHISIAYPAICDYPKIAEAITGMRIEGKLPVSIMAMRDLHTYERLFPLSGQNNEKIS